MRQKESAAAETRWWRLPSSWHPCSAHGIHIPLSVGSASQCPWLTFRLAPPCSTNLPAHLSRRPKSGSSSYTLSTICGRKLRQDGGRLRSSAADETEPAPMERHIPGTSHFGHAPDSQQQACTHIQHAPRHLKQTKLLPTPKKSNHSSVHCIKVDKQPEKGKDLAGDVPPPGPALGPRKNWQPQGSHDISCSDCGMQRGIGGENMAGSAGEFVLARPCLIHASPATLTKICVAELVIKLELDNYCRVRQLRVGGGTAGQRPSLGRESPIGSKGLRLGHTYQGKEDQALILHKVKARGMLAVGIFDGRVAKVEPEAVLSGICSRGSRDRFGSRLAMRVPCRRHLHDAQSACVQCGTGFQNGLALRASQLHFVHTGCIASALPLSSSSPKISESRGSQRTRVGRLGPLPCAPSHRGPSLPCNPCQCCIPLIGQYASAQVWGHRPASDHLWARVLWNKRVLMEERKKEIKCTPGCDGRAQDGAWVLPRVSSGRGAARPDQAGQTSESASASGRGKVLCG